LIASFGLAAYSPGDAALNQAIERELRAIEPRMIAWRRDIHEHPELGNREFRTSALVADHLERLGFSVRRGVANTGVVAVIAGSKPGPVIALRADMDALPVTEKVDLPFASKVKASWQGKTVGVMHACGHDAHTAILMAVAEMLAKFKKELPGTVKLIFQPAEESLPQAESWGARLMIKDGALENPVPEAIFGLHVSAFQHSGTIGYRAGAILAGSDTFRIVVKGKQTHGAQPWDGVDPIVVGSQIVLGLQTIASRQVNIMRAPVVLTVGAFNAGDRHNIIPETAVMQGTLRTYDQDMRVDVMRRVTETAAAIARSAGAQAQVDWVPGGYPPTVNNATLTARMLPTLQRIAGAPDRIRRVPLGTSAEDFALYAQKIPGMFFFIGVTPANIPGYKAAPNHSPHFTLDEAGMMTGLKAMVALVFDYARTAP
jgi:amidohydrolase